MTRELRARPIRISRGPGIHLVRASRAIALIIISLVPKVSSAQAPVWKCGSESFTLYRANLHVHTKLSLGGEPEDAGPTQDLTSHGHCEWPRETYTRAMGLGLGCIGFSDHCLALSRYDWEGLERVSGEAAGRGLAALRGFEWTGPYHVNVFGTNGFVSAAPREFEGEKQCDPAPTLADLYQWVGRVGPGAVCQFNHPNWNGPTKLPETRPFRFDGRTFGRPNDPRVTDAFSLLEIGSGGNPGYEGNDPAANEKWFRLALARGWRVAPTIGIDNNRELTRVARVRHTGVWVEGDALSPKALLEALRSRRTFASEEADYVLRVWALRGDRRYPMGTTLPAAGRERTALYIEASNPTGVGIPTIVEVHHDGSARETRLGPAYANSLSHQWLRLLEPSGDTVCWYVRVDKRRELIEGSGIPTEASTSHVFSAPIWLQPLIYEWPGGHTPGHPGVGAAGMPDAEAVPRGPIDLVFCIDATGSMTDDIDRVKQDASELVARLRARSTSLRIGLVTYRDFAVDGDRHLETNLPLTEQLDDVVTAVRAIRTTGGGDAPEDVLDGLKAAIDMPWREGVAKFILLMGDAPAKDPDHEGKTRDTIAAAAKAVDPAHVYALALGGAASSSQTLESFRGIASLTGGEAFAVADAAELTGAIEDAVAIAAVDHVAEVTAISGGGGAGPVAAGTDWQTSLFTGCVVGILVLGTLCVAVAVRRRSSRAAPPERPRSWLQVRAPGAGARNFALRETVIRIGRGPGNQVVLSDPKAAVHHAELRLHDRGAVITDLGSTHGTWVNGRRVSRGPVRPGDQVRIGETVMVLWHGAASRP